MMICVYRQEAILSPLHGLFNLTSTILLEQFKMSLSEI